MIVVVLFWPSPALRSMLGFVLLHVLLPVSHAGGWDIVTLKDFPDFAVAGQPLSLTFTVWVPSLEPLANLQPNIRASFCTPSCIAERAPYIHATKAKRTDAKASVKPDFATGEYTAELILPEPGNWVITIDTEYAGASVLPTLKVIAPGTAVPTPLSLADRGSWLFTAKGCNACHLRKEVGRVYGPDLTNRGFAPEYLKRFLTDPNITAAPKEVCSQDRSYCGSPYPMPSLNLTDTEIESLIAFINQK